MQPPTLDAFPESLRARCASIGGALRAAGFQAWAVGGAVRDAALGRVPSDLDLATDARPDAIEALFPDALGVGRAFGTMIVVQAGVEVQITTFRSERGYSDRRHPDEVIFGDTPEEDAKRRDFTVNALFLDAVDGRFCDPVDGLEDLAARRLRAVGPARDRFAEDALRILRLARFAATHGLTPEVRTLAGAQAEVEGLRKVSPERILHELERSFAGHAAAPAVRWLNELGALPLVLGSDPPASCGDVLAALGERATPEAAFVLLADWDPGAVEELLRRLMSSSRFRRIAVELARHTAALPAALERPSRASAWRILRESEGAQAAACLRAGGRLARTAQARLDHLERELRAAPRSVVWPDSLLGAKELAQAGVPRGPDWGRTLRALEDAQLDGTVLDRAAAETWLRARIAES